MKAVAWRSKCIMSDKGNRAEGAVIVKFLRTAFYISFTIWMGGGLLTWEYGTAAKRLEMLMSMTSHDVTMMNIRGISVNLFGSISIILGLVLLGAWLSKRMQKAPGNFARKPDNTSLGIKVERDILSQDGLQFSVHFSTDRYLVLEFSQIEKTNNPLYPGGVQEVGGILRFDKTSLADFTVTLVITPFNIISLEDSDVGENYLSQLSANGIEFYQKYDSYTIQNDIYIDPTSIDEEGWIFKFEKPRIKSVMNYDLTEVPSRKIISDLMTCQSAKWSVCRHIRSSREVWEATKFSGETIKIVSVNFPHMDFLRDKFCRAFGRDALEDFAAEHGLKFT